RFRLTILDGNSPSVSSGIYSESHSVTTTASGLFQFQIGGGTVENGNFSSIPWSDNQKYVKLEVDTNGGTNYKHFATSQLVSVPFALAAGSAGTAGSTSSIKDQNGTPYTVSTQNGSPTLVATGGGSVLAGCGADFLYKDQYYSTVVINGQCWMAENLNVGSMITTSTTQANNGLFEKYCYGNDPAKCSQFGGLYQWAEAMDYKSSATNTTAPNPVFQDFVQGICPKGWHIPTYEDFLGLKDLYPTNVSASLRSSNNLWYTPGTNESNFNLLPAGSKLGTGSGFLLSSTGLWYSHSTTNANTNYLWSISTGSNSFTSPTKTDGYSVRCVKNGCMDVQAFAGQDFLQICNDSVQLAALDPGNGLKGRWTVKS
ncbi:MAG: hypothetical protein EBR91_11765, partial [Flavobacteriia bacterium]|nr:hypothetical protein [Flavobacteriia bacterium]